MQTILIKPASGLCNMHCDYCFYCDEASKRKIESYGMMSEETLRSIVKKVLLGARGDVCFAFQGGEPTLRGLDFFRTLLEYQEKFNKNRVVIQNSIQTNGLELNCEWCEFLKKHQFLVGISVDGTRQSHDAYRHTKARQATYEQVVQSARLMDEYGVDYNILTVVNQATAENIADIYVDYKRNGWTFQQYIACLDPYGEEGVVEPYTLTAQAYGKFLIQLFDLWYKDWRKGRAPYIRQFENYIGILMGHSPESCEQKGVCSVQFVVEADGSVYPCDFYVLDEYKLGNFNEHRMSELFQCSTAAEFVAQSRPIHPDCRECAYYSVCRGGCRRNKVSNLDSGINKNRFCESYRMFFDKAYKRMEEIARFLM